MKRPPINYLLEKSKESFLRFPMTLICALTVVSIGIYLVEYQEDIKNIFPYINLLIVSALGIPLFFGLSIFISSRGYKFSTSLISHGLAGIVLVVIYLSLPDASHTHNTTIPYIRYGVFNVIIHLLVSFSPFLREKKLNGFWNFNKVLFIRFLTSVLYSGFLYLGLILALFAFKVLFDIKIPEELFLKLYIIIIGLFNTWFFVSEIPSNIGELENIKTYPKGLKVFTQYVLLPLLAIYLIILYAYGAKVLIYWNWPKGIVSYLISCVSILGVLTTLLLYPYGLLKESIWINRVTKIFYFILYPLIVILFIAIGIRIWDYGITVNRYAIVLLGLWLTIISSYFSFRGANIKIIPISLALILGVTSFGPWSIFSVSESNQVNRLTSILANNNLIQNKKIINEVMWETDSLPDKFFSNKINTNEGKLNDSLLKEVKSIVEYLDNHHGFSQLKSLFKQDIDSLIVISLDADKSRDEASLYMQTFGLIRYHDNSYEDLIDYYLYRSIKKDVVVLRPFDYLVNFRLGERGDSFKKVVIDNVLYHIELKDKNKNIFSFTSKYDTVNFHVKNILKGLNTEYDSGKRGEIEQSKMTFIGQSNIFKLKVIFDYIDVKESKDTKNIMSLKGRLFLKKIE